MSSPEKAADSGPAQAGPGRPCEAASVMLCRRRPPPLSLVLGSLALASRPHLVGGWVLFWVFCLYTQRITSLSLKPNSSVEAHLQLFLCQIFL